MVSDRDGSREGKDMKRGGLWSVVQLQILWKCAGNGFRKGGGGGGGRLKEGWPRIRVIFQ